MDLKRTEIGERLYAGVVRCDTEIQKSLDKTRKLRNQKRRNLDMLYKWMKENDVEKIGKITIEQAMPLSLKQKPKLKPAGVRSADVIQLFKSHGIPDPIEKYKEFILLKKKDERITFFSLLGLGAPEAICEQIAEIQKSRE